MADPHPFRNRWPRAERRYRAARKARLHRYGIKPTMKTWLTCVETTALVIPQWARDRADTRLTVEDHKVWFRGRSGRQVVKMVALLVDGDREAGGEPDVTKVQYAVCEVCGRLLLGVEAEERRTLNESSKDGRKLPCTGDCNTGGNTHGN